MRKLKLAVDALRVESFAPVAEDGRGGGTVYAHVSFPDPCLPPSDSVDPALDTCVNETCAGVSCIGHTCEIVCGTGATDVRC